MYYNHTYGFVTPNNDDVDEEGYFNAIPVDAVPPGTTSAQATTSTQSAPFIERQAPPSSYAVAAVLDGEEGSLSRLVGLTVLRATFIFPGLWVGSKMVSADLKLWQTALLSLTTSVGITSGMLLWYKVQKDWNKRVAAASQAVNQVRYQSFDGR